jgi:hypothetical protein
LLTLVVGCELYVIGVNVAIISHEKIPFNFGAPKEIWDLSRSKFVNWAIEIMRFHLSNL